MRLFLIFLCVIFTSTASAHSGGLDSRGCHAGSGPYHCHSTTVVTLIPQAPAVQYPDRYLQVGDSEGSLITIRGMHSTESIAIASTECEDGYTQIQWHGGFSWPTDAGLSNVVQLYDTKSQSSCRLPLNSEVCVLSGDDSLIGFYLSMTTMARFENEYTLFDLDRAYIGDSCWRHEDTHKVYRVLYRQTETQECPVVSSTPSTPAVAECIDSDGDGWGWDGVQSCIPTN